MSAELTPQSSSEQPSPNASSATSPSNRPRTRRRVKPALKKDPVHIAGNEEPLPSEKTDRHLQWDEKAIAEHDLLRGTRMKIEEPNTPFNYDSGAESDGSYHKSPNSSSSDMHQPRSTSINWDTLEDKLNEAAQNCPSSPSSYAPSEGDALEEEEKHRQFVEARKKHYNEMELVRRFRLEHPDGLDDADQRHAEDDGDAGNDADDDMDE
mmetsp:Transcript_27368/g.40083  ORF Transcript_27368/g.40083 Transcript_27368/m.40083 type:complete len:209 (-) Transcript_27368:154-780(-)|eukprot:CAMPEP_0194027482 /NCGR_PEP_ID=MMETSP0009_2-20130614/1628_1 /TAXON_ID=210454 /ORGANISM="Grammatophora oceanica, Strain CCMP 410" /LENGTH=208 /DNA_ID=CAMNT_0038666563 /DNA_START=110 /DNA_END=736 /DNA_ORIENTATION=+